MASFTHLPVVEPGCQETIPLSTSYDDAISESAYAESSPHPSLSPKDFEFLEEEGVLEDGYSSRSGRRDSWWDYFRPIMTVGRRRKPAECEQRDEAQDGLLADAYLRRRLERKKTLYNYCVYGGISGFTIL